MDEQKKPGSTYCRRKAAGLCVQCGTAPADPGRILCTACAVVFRKRERDLRRRRRDAGICTRCGKAPARPGRALCPECSERENAYRRGLARREPCNRDCLNCALPDCTGGRTTRDRLREAGRRLYYGRKDAGLCTMCGKVPPRPGRSMCPACAEKARERNRRQAAKRRGAAKDGA